MSAKLPKREPVGDILLEKPRKIHALILIGVVAFALGLSGLYLTKGNFIVSYLENHSKNNTRVKVPDNVAVIVNGTEILKEEYMRQLDIALYSLENNYPEITGQAAEQRILDLQPDKVLDQVIMDELIMQFLKSNKSEITDKDVIENIKNGLVAQEYGGDMAVYEAELVNKFQKTIDDVVIEQKRNLSIFKVNEILGHEPKDFDAWYFSFRESASVIVNPNL